MPLMFGVVACLHNPTSPGCAEILAGPPMWAFYVQFATLGIVIVWALWRSRR